MRSIRWSLLLYFLLVLGVAMAAVSLLVYQRMSETLAEKESAAIQLVHEQYEDQKKDERDKFDEKLLAKARTLINLARFQSSSNRSFASGNMWSDWQALNGIKAGPTISGLSSSQANQMSSGLLYALATAYFLPELQFDEDELYRDKEEDANKEYLQVDTNFRNTGWRSSSMGNRSFPVSRAIFSTAQNNRNQLAAVLAGANVDPLHLLAGLALPVDEESPIPLLEPQIGDRELEPGHTVRCVSLKAPISSVNLYNFFEAWALTRPAPGRGRPGNPPNSPRRISFERPQFFIYVQCAGDTTDRDQILAKLYDKRDQDVANIQETSRASLASLRKHLWLICGVTFASTAIGGYLLVVIGLWPLKRVGEAVSKVSPKDFKLPLGDRPLPVELRPIVERLNVTLALLKRTFAREKQAVADISHDLRTPVAALLASTEVALRKPRTAEQYREVIEDCHSTGKQMSRIVECLLALARLDAGVDRIHTSDVDVTDLAEECVNLVRPLANERQLDLQLHRNGPIPVHTDPAKVREVLTNLLHNAIQYNRPHGSVSLSVERENGTLRLAVSDTGIGIAPDAREHIFERFYRADPSRHGDLNDITSGGDSLHSGLGLAIVKGYVDLLGGSIAVESTLGQGSTFRIELPAVPVKSTHDSDVERKPAIRSA